MQKIYSLILHLSAFSEYISLEFAFVSLCKGLYFGVKC